MPPQPGQAPSWRNKALHGCATSGGHEQHPCLLFSHTVLCCESSPTKLPSVTPLVSFFLSSSFFPYSSTSSILLDSPGKSLSSCCLTGTGLWGHTGRDQGCVYVQEPSPWPINRVECMAVILRRMCPFGMYKSPRKRRESLPSTDLLRTRPFVQPVPTPLVSPVIIMSFFLGHRTRAS